MNNFIQDLPPKEFHKTMTAKWERMLACIVNDGGHVEKDIVDRDGDKYNE